VRPVFTPKDRKTFVLEDRFMSIVRVGLAETKNFAEGYDAIFAKKKDEAEQDKTEEAQKQEQNKQDKAQQKKG